MIEKLTSYLIARCGRLFSDWTPSQIEDYVLFHAGQRTLVGVMDSGMVQGVMVAWRQDEKCLTRWRWQRQDPAGRYLWVDHFAAESPRVALQLVEDYLARWELEGIEIAGRRHNHNRVFSPRVVGKLITKARKLYGNKCSSTTSN